MVVVIAMEVLSMPYSIIFRLVTLSAQANAARQVSRTSPSRWTVGSCRTFQTVAYLLRSICQNNGWTPKEWHIDGFYGTIIDWSQYVSVTPISVSAWPSSASGRKTATVMVVASSAHPKNERNEPRVTCASK